MKITFTGITKEEAIKRLEAAAAEGRAFAARIRAKNDPRFSSSVKAEDSKVLKYEKLAQIIRNADGNTISIETKDEGSLYFGLARGESTFYDADHMYMVTPESVSEMPFELMLAIGEQEASKTANM